MKRYIKYIIIFVVSIIVLVLFEIGSPKKIDWSPSFSLPDKVPYGSYILYKILPDIFPGKKITPVYYSIYDTFNKKPKQQDNYIFIAENFTVDDYDYNILESLVKNGSHVFIAAKFFSGKLAKDFNIKTAYHLTSHAIGTTKLVNKKYSGTSYTYKQHLGDYYFTAVPKNTIVLGMTNDKRANYVKIRHGKGVFLLSSVPHAFTNYGMLYNNNWQYTAYALSYLPVRNTWWDEYYKPKTKQVRTPLRFILTNKSFSWAYYLALVTIMIFIVIKGKRTQRIIPVIKPLPNDTLEFVATVGRLYYEQKDHKNIVGKRITALFDYIKTRFYVDASRIKTKDYAKLAEKCAVPVERIKDLFAIIKNTHTRDSLSEKELLQLNKLIEAFYIDTKK